MAPTAAERLADQGSSADNRRGRVTVVANLKGGVSKTTTTVNLACCLGRGIRHWRTGEDIVPPQRVLLIDTEPLCTASTWLGVEAEGPLDSVAALFDDPPEGALENDSDWSALIRRLPRPAANEPIDVIAAEPASIELVDSQKGESEFSLQDNLEILRRDYDHIIIDTPANAKNRMLRSALIAADGVIIPVPPTSAVVTSVKPLFKILRDIKRGANRTLQVDGLLISNAGGRGDRDAYAAQRGLSEIPGVPVFGSMIRTLKAIQRSAAVRCSVFGMADAEEAVRDYQQFATEWFHITARRANNG